MSAPRTRQRFSTTCWTLVATAGRSGDVDADGALRELCQVYWPPLYGYLRSRGHCPEDAQDLTQGFFVCLLERRSLRLADPARGRFRSFLLTALKRYVVNAHEHATAVRRGGRMTTLSLDFEEAERTYTLDRRNDDTPARIRPSARSISISPSSICSAIAARPGKSRKCSSRPARLCIGSPATLSGRVANLMSEQPRPSTFNPANVSGHRSNASGTPSLSSSGGGTNGGAARRKN
jgi:hypothetical protein